MKKYIAPLCLLLTFFVEVVLLNTLMALIDPTKKLTNTLWSRWETSSFLPISFANAWTVFVVPLSIILFFMIWHFIRFQTFEHQTVHKPKISFLRTFIQVFKADISTFFGILTVLYLATNIAWLQNFIMDAIKEQSAWQYVWFTLLWIIVPFVWVNPKKHTDEKIIPEKRKLLITGISGQYSNTPNWSKYYTGWYYNWEPIRAFFEVYPNLERVLIIHSDFTLEQSKNKLPSEIANWSNPVGSMLTQEAINDFEAQKGEIKSLQDLFKRTIPNGGRLEIIERVIPDENEFDTFFPILKPTIGEVLKKYQYQDEDVVFALTGGTAVLTSAFAFLSMRGKQGCVYTRQDNAQGSHPRDKKNEFTTSIYTITELWQEIIDQSKADLES